MMRRWILWCLLALLPFRLWAGDAMVLHGIHPGLSAGHATAAAAQAHGIHGGCHEATNASSAPEHAVTVNGFLVASDTDSDDHAGCHLCDVCHSPAHVAVVAWLPGPVATHEWRLIAERPVPSLTVQPRHKPPIA